MVDNYASDRSYFDSGFSHPALSRELDGRVQYEVQSVMTRLRVSSIDDQFVDECKKTLQTKLADDIKTLKSLAAAADRRSVEDLENEADDEAEENNGPRFGPMKSHREQLMYGPLVRVLRL